jgi:hypothetical protein
MLKRITFLKVLTTCHPKHWALAHVMTRFPANGDCDTLQNKIHWIACPDVANILHHETVERNL